MITLNKPYERPYRVARALERKLTLEEERLRAARKRAEIERKIDRMVDGEIEAARLGDR